MATNLDSQLCSWTRLGNPPMGTVSAIACGQAGETILFVGSQVGIHRVTGIKSGAFENWERLANAPGGVLALAVSPAFTEDHALLAGTGTGIWISKDTGKSWKAAHLPLSHSTILSIVYSPDFIRDGIVIAGTLEDGVFYSDTRGETWSTRNFGLLEPCVFSIAFSPEFSRDGRVFAGTGSGLYFSYNHARAWKPMPFPGGAVPVLSLAVSPDFQNDQLIFAGTEDTGLFRSRDMGRIWQQIDLPASSINALTIRQDQNVLLTATENGVFASSNSGEQWEHLIIVSAALCVTCCGSETLAGMLDHGIWISSPGRDSQPAADLANRTLLGMLLSDFFDQDGTGFLYGPGEGIWKTLDGGASWERLEQIPPHLEIAQLAIHASPGSTHLLVAASTGGVLRSVDAGKHWEVCSEEPADQIVLSPDGKILAANFPRQGLHVSRDQGTTWQDVPGPWDASGKILALRVSNLGQYYIAFLEGSEETISLWQGLPGCFEQILAHPCGSNSMVSLSISPDASPDQPWYMALGASVWRFCTHPNEPGVVKEILPELPAGTTIFSLVVENEKGRPLLLLSSGQQIFLSRGGEPWRMTHDLGQERALKIVLPRSGSAQGIAYVLLLGGSLCRIDLPVTDL